MNFNEIRDKTLVCQDCKDKFGFSPVPIIHGNQYSKIMQISQAPSNNVHITKRPFNDPSGAKLNTNGIRYPMRFFTIDNFYITALSHCFPGKNVRGGDNPPLLACARKWLMQEIELVQNRLYIIIGSKAAKFLFPSSDFVDLVFLSNVINVINDRPAIVLPHPSPLNIKWFKDHPSFEVKRLPEVRKIIRRVLN